MTFDWKGYLEVAYGLADGNVVSNRESALRSAVSRAYYAAFHTAYSHCLSLGYQFYGDGRDHEQVRVHLRARSLPDVADDLLRLHRWRIYADYRGSQEYDLQMMWLGARLAAEAILDALR